MVSLYDDASVAITVYDDEYKANWHKMKIERIGKNRLTVDLKFLQSSYFFLEKEKQIAYLCILHGNKQI